MTFQLDTSGRVIIEVSEAFETYYEWSDLSPFTQGYIEALFVSAGWLAAEDWSWGGKTVLRGFSDLAPETLARIIADCEADQKVGVRLNLAGNREDRTSFKAGRRYWKERQTGNLFDAPPLTVQLGDDGKVRFADPARSSEGEGAQ